MAPLCLPSVASAVFFSIHLVLITDGTAVIPIGRVAVPLSQRIIAVSGVLIPHGHTVVLGPVRIPHSYGTVIRVVGFPDGHAVFLGMGIMAHRHGTAPHGQYIAAQSHRVGRIHEPRHHQIAVYERSVRSRVTGTVGGDIAVVVQPVPGIVFFAGQFAIGIHIIAADCVQHFGLVADGRGMGAFRNVVDAHRRSAAHIIGFAGAVRADIRGHAVIDVYSLVVVLIAGIISPFRILGPHIVLVIHILSGDQAVHLDLFFFVLFRFRIVHLCGDPLGVDVFIRIRGIPVHRFLRIGGMGKGAHAVAGTDDHVFRLVFHPGIPCLGIVLDADHFVVLAGDQISFAVVGHIGIAALGRGRLILFDVHSLAGRSIVFVGGRCIRCNGLGPH